MKFYQLVFFSLATTFLTVNAAKAQESLSLSDAIQRGLENNFDIKLEKLTVDVNRRNNNWGEAGRYPSINLQVNQQNNRRNIENEASFLQGAIISNNINPQVNLNWTIFDGFRANITKSRLEKLQAESEGNAAIVVQNTMQAIILGYYQAVYQRENIQVIRNSLNVSQDRYRYILLKKELGSAVTTEVLLEEGTYLTDSLNYLNQQVVYRNAIRNLNVLLAEENTNKDYIFTDSLAYELNTYEFSDLVEKLKGNNANLRKEYISQAIIKDNIGIAKADRYPSLALSSTYSYDQARQDLSGSSFANDPSRDLISNAITNTASINFTVSFNLYNGGRVNRAIENAMVQYDISNLRVEQFSQSLLRDLSSEYDLYTNRLSLKGIAERRKEAAELNMTLSFERYKTGSISSFDYRTVQINYLQAALQDLQATLDLIESNTALMRLTGSIVEVAE
ncbi:TolC family protein [Flammeovirgaceae bacterium SG7u.111]|nr:TolC family protein [Flammeovirgaceae bacterium SG7u.132]WPO35171.1 TolC family protein [Flammeovirgaceae bacterium SG7u.111]